MAWRPTTHLNLHTLGIYYSKVAIPPPLCIQAHSHDIRLESLWNYLPLPFHVAARVLNCPMGEFGHMRRSIHRCGCLRQRGDQTGPLWRYGRKSAGGWCGVR